MDIAYQKLEIVLQSDKPQSETRSHQYWMETDSSALVDLITENGNCLLVENHYTYPYNEVKIVVKAYFISL